MTLTMAAADRECRRISRRHGVSYFWATTLLGPEQRRHVRALYAFCRRADDIVDAGTDIDDRAARLARFRADFERAVRTGRSEEAALLAVARTVEHHGLAPELFDRFFAAMETDLTVAAYDTWADLLGYMDGSAAVIGEMMLPILEPTDPVTALDPARHLGLAFQLTNFLRDIGEDLDLGRQYLPRADLERFGVDLSSRTVTPAFVELMRFEIDRCRGLYQVAERGLDVLPPRSRRCIAAAHRSYRGILDEIERNGYDVFGHRASVPIGRKLAGVAAELLR